MITATATIMTLEEAADYLRVSVELLQQQAAIGQVPGRKIGDEWRFLSSAIESWLSTPNIMMTHQTLAEVQARNSQVTALLNDWNNDADAVC